MNRDEIEKLLDGTTPGPWTVRGPTSQDGFMIYDVGMYGVGEAWNINGSPENEANAKIMAAAPRLARTVITLHAQLADAKAAQAMVVERAAGMIEDNFRHAKELGREVWAFPDLRTLADTDGLALVQALRAEISAWREGSQAVTKALSEMRTDRDRLAAANAALEAQVAALEWFSEVTAEAAQAAYARVAALAEVQARDEGAKG